MKYYLVTENSDMYDKLVDVYTHPKGWFGEAKKEIVELIGYDYGSKFVIDDEYLWVKNIKDGYEKSFCKDTVLFDTCKYYKAKGNSKINKEYKNICNKYGLKVYTLRSFHFDYFYSCTITCNKFEDRLDDGDIKYTFILSFDDEQINSSMKEISEKEYLELRLKYIDK